MSGLPPPPPAQGGQPYPVGPYGATATQLTRARPLAGLATALTVLLALAAIVELAAAAAFFNRASLLQDASNGIFPGIDEGTAADDRVAGMVILHVIAFLATAVVFIIWQYRHAKNAQLLGAREGLGPGWAIGGWFVPFANYVLPAMQMHQSSRASDIEGRAKGGRGRGSGLVILWGIVFALAALTLVGSGGFGSGSDNAQFTSVQDIEDAASEDRTAAAGMILYAAAAVAAILMVRSLTSKQAAASTASEEATARALATHFGAPGAAPPTFPPPPPGQPPRPTPAEEATAFAGSSPDWAAQSPQRDYAPPPPPGAPPPATPPPPPAPQAPPPPPPADTGPPPPPAPE